MHPRYYYISSLLHKWLYHMTFLFSTNFLGMLWAGSLSCLLLRPVEDHNTTDENEVQINANEEWIVKTSKMTLVNMYIAKAWLIG